MDRVYNLRRHTHCAIIYMGKTDIVISCCSSLKRIFGSAEYGLTDEASVTYNRQKTKVLGWSNWNIDEENENQVKIDNFMEGIYHVFQKGKSNWNKKDLFLIRAMSDLIRLAVGKVLKDSESVIENLDSLHYVFVVPSEWEEEIRNDLIRPIFFQSGLISKDDHNDRLLFVLDIETIFYNLQDSNNEIFQRGQHTLLCKVKAVEYEKAVIQLNLIQTWNPLFDIPNSKLFPRVIRSVSSSVIGVKEIKTDLKLFLESRLFPVSASVDRTQTVEIIADDIFNSVRPEDMDTEDSDDEYINEIHVDDKLMATCVTDTSRYGLNEAQTKFIKSICVLDICQEINQTLFDTMKNILSYNFTKEYKLLILKDLYYSELDIEPSLFEWIKYTLEYNRRNLSVTITNIELKKDSIERDDVLSGAGFSVMQNIRNSDMHSEPHILITSKLDVSPSAFENSGPEAIISIDISTKSTSLRYLLLNDDGSVEKIFNKDYFIKNKSLPYLGDFYNFSEVTTLNVKEKFILFAEKHFLNSLSPFSTKHKELLPQIEHILDNQDSIKEIKISTQQTKYIKAFLLMYIVYLKEIISTCLISESKFGVADSKIGYVVYIEKGLLDNIVDTKEELKSLIFESGLIQKNETSKKLYVITKGEMMLHALQKYLKTGFPLKAYILVTQVYDNYVQLTLNQVITSYTGEDEEQETIIVQDEVLPIQNVYNSLCLNFWNTIMQNHSFIQLCPKHNEDDENIILELFSLKTKTEFMKTLNTYISENILAEKLSFKKIDKVLLQMNTSCFCKVCLTDKDMIEIAFRPMLQGIASLISASLINKNLFGNYTDLKYLYNFIHFNNNPQFQNTLASILNDELDNLNLERGVDLRSMTLIELPDQILQPILLHRPFLYKQFRFGILNQVFSDNYAISLYQDTRGKFKSSYKNKITDTESIEFDDDNAFLLFKKGDIVRNGQFNRVFYFKQLQCNFGEELHIRICNFKTFNKLRYNGLASLEDNVWEHLYNYVLPLKSNDINADGSLPLMISVRYQAYSSSLQFSAKVVGSGFSGEVFEAGEPLTLNRFQ